jgi:predicted amino acid dehydrogenase
MDEYLSDDTFAFIIHPITIRKDVNRKFPPLGTILPEPVIHFASQFFPPLYISEITGVASQATGKQIRGWFLAVPFTPQTMLRLPVERAYNKIVATGKKAEKLGAKMLGLGAYTSVVGDAGITIAERLDIPVTTGDSYTVAVAIEALYEAARYMRMHIPDTTVAVVGATGAIGKACARMLAKKSGKLILVGKRPDALNAVRELCEGQAAQVIASTDINVIYEADLVLTVTSAVEAIIEPQHLKPGAVVLDVARPRDVSIKVAQQRDDVLVIEGGMVETPGANVDFHFNFGFPPRKVFACMAETMTLALEGIYDDYTLGRDLEIERIEHISHLAHKHGFRLAGLRSFEFAVTDDTINTVLERAVQKRKTWSPVTS